MTEERLRSIVKEATQKQQIGIIIYANWATYGQFGEGDNPYYNEAVENVKNGSCDYCSSLSYNNSSIPAFTAIPLELLKNKEYVKMFLNTCRDYFYEEVISTIPDKEIVDTR